MLQNYLKIALRNLWRERVYAGINIAGLAIGLASCILLMLFVRNELSYDTFHPNADRLYRVWVTETPPDRDAFSYSFTSSRIDEAFEESLPEVKRSVRVAVRTDLIRVAHASFTERIHLVDGNFFEAFNFPLVKGSPASVLQNPNAVVLTRKTANKFFGNEDVIDQTIAIKLGDEYSDYVVSGIAADPPENSSIKFDLLIPSDNLKKYIPERALNSLFNIYLETYVELHKPLQPGEIKNKLAAIVQKHYPERFRDRVTLHLQPITDIHLNTNIPEGIEPISNPLYSYILTCIAFLILIIACINFTTLAIGRSAPRAREVGVRKVLGAFKQQLIAQFCGEAMLMSLFALLLGLLLADLLLPTFNQLAQTHLTLTADVAGIAGLAVLAILVGLLAGGYPAFVLARFQPVTVLRRAVAAGDSNRLGKALMVLQFSISIFLIISTLVVADQLRFLLNKDLGYNKEQLLVIENKSAQQESAALVERLRSALANDRRILGVSGASSSFGKPWTTMGFNAADGSFKQFYQLTTDYDFLETMQIHVVNGRGFSREFATDSTQAIVINQALADYLDWQEPLSEHFPGSGSAARVIGVTENFNFESLEKEVAPLAMVLQPATLMKGINDVMTSFALASLNFIHVRVAPGNMSQVITDLQKRWQDVAPNQPFAFTFVDQNVQKQYDKQQRLGKIIQAAALFTILIGCMGLFGLSALTASRRRKEIGIRKVLGASVSNIVFLVSNEFARLVLVSNLVAWPLAYWVMRRWLQNFAYNVGLGSVNFFLAGLAALVIAWLTVSFQSVKAATVNPVQTLKYE